MERNKENRAKRERWRPKSERINQTPVDVYDMDMGDTPRQAKIRQKVENQRARNYIAGKLDLKDFRRRMVAHTRGKAGRELHTEFKQRFAEEMDVRSLHRAVRLRDIVEAIQQLDERNKENKARKNAVVNKDDTSHAGIRSGEKVRDPFDARRLKIKQARRASRQSELTPLQDKIAGKVFNKKLQDFADGKYTSADARRDLYVNTRGKTFRNAKS